MENIERFDRTVGLIFAKLYKSFPERITLVCRDVTDYDGADISLEDVNNYWLNQSHFKATMDWLIVAGFIWCRPPDDVPTSAYFDCCLSVKGLESLKATPAGLTGESLGAQLQSAAKSGLLDTVKSLSGQALSVGASMGFSAFKALVDS